MAKQEGEASFAKYESIKTKWAHIFLAAIYNGDKR